MTRRLLLVRHGNTFEDGTTPTRVGMRSDLPLTEKGLVQATQFADAARDAGLALGPFVSGPLLRTRIFLSHGFGIAPRLDDRLREIDYGNWEGLTDAEISALVGPSMLESWNKNCVWPDGQNWAPSPAVLSKGAESLVRELAAGDPSIVPVLCSSQGVLRYFAKIDATFFARAKLGVGTGSCCGVSVGARGLRVDFWNEKPDSRSLKAWFGA